MDMNEQVNPPIAGGEANLGPVGAAGQMAKHLSTVLRPNPARTVVRPFFVGDPAGFADKDKPRTQRIAERVLTMDDAALQRELKIVAQELDVRHDDVEERLRQRFDELEELATDRDRFTPDQALLIGAYFSEEYSFESAALFNPSAVTHPDQSGAAPGDTRFVMSLRGIGEGHVSSLTFRTGTWKANGDVQVDAPSPRAIGPSVERSTGAQGEQIVQLTCGGAREISESVIFPFMPSQGRGIEDVRLVEFTEDDGAKDYRGTYTAFNGSDVRQAMLRTSDFRTFEMRGVLGDMASGKGMALFPRRVNGRFAMLGRQDNENIWLLTSDDPFTWNGGQRIVAPKYPWEFIQMGNCGSPIEVDEGWLVLTHGVGVVRTYCMGACLLDRDDPSKVLARLPKPLLEPTEKEHDGYVPNVVYSCGGFVRDRTLLLPYGVSDNVSAFATVELDRLMAEMT